MTDERNDIRDPDPQVGHRGAFMAGWTAAENGTLYDSVLTRKTHQNMGNLFGWIYGKQPRVFKLETWYRYCGHTLVQVDEPAGEAVEAGDGAPGRETQLRLSASGG